MSELLTPAEMDALRLLGLNRRLLLILIPKTATDAFTARLTAWASFCLDTKLLPPLWLPASKEGNGLVCPFCHCPATIRLETHASSCDWRQAAYRWGAAQMEIDADFGALVES